MLFFNNRLVVFVVVFVVSVLLEECLCGDAVTKYVPLKISSPSTGNGFEISVPTSGTREVGNPKELWPRVKEAWDVVVETNQAGLVDAKQVGMAAQPLSEQEAWHHYSAGREGVIDSARFLITFYLLPSIQSGGHTLHIATIHNNIARVKFLVEEEGVDVDILKPSDKMSALVMASVLGYSEMVETLIGLGADVDHMTKAGVTPLMSAASLGQVAIVRMLLVAGADRELVHPFAQTSALHFASEMGHADVIELMCNESVGQSSRQSSLGNIRNKNGGTPLHTAADTNQSKSVMALLTHCGSETEVLLNQDTTPLYLASQRGFADIVDTLLVTGQSNIDYVMPAGKLKGEMQVYGEEKANYYKSKNNEVGNGATALHAAVENGHLAAVRVLLGHNAKQLPSMQGASPLLIALQYRHPRIAMALLSKNRTAHVNLATAHDGMFPLYVACKYSYHKVVERMLQRGAQIDKALHGKEFAILDVVHSKRVMAVLNKHMARKP